MIAIDSKKTMIGVGIGVVPRVLAAEPSRTVEPAIVISGEIAMKSFEDGSGTTSRVRVPRRLARWKLVAIVLAGVAASSALALAVRGAAFDGARATSHRVPAPRPAVAAITRGAAPAIPPPTPLAAAAPEPRRIELGDGSCSTFIDAKVPAATFVDEQPVGVTPVTVSGLWCGRRVTIRVERGGFATWTKTISPQEGRASRVVATLRRPAPPTPPGASPTVMILPLPLQLLSAVR